MERQPTEPIEPLNAWRKHKVEIHQGAYDTNINNPGKDYPTITLGDIFESISSPANVVKESAPATIGSAYGSFDARSHEVQRVQGTYFLLRFDVDKGDHPIETISEAFTYALGNIAFAIYSTSSATKDNPRWRVIAPICKAISHDERRAIEIIARDYLQMLWGIDTDSAMDRAGQHIYLPAVAPSKRNAKGDPFYYVHQIFDGPAFNLDTWNHRVSVQSLIDDERKKTLEIEAAATEAQERRESRRKRAIEKGEFTPIEFFNANNQIIDILIESGYSEDPSDPNNWSSPYQNSGSYATRVFDDYFVSLSQSDAEAGFGFKSRNGYISGDAFSLYAHYEYGGDAKAAVKAIVLSKDFQEIANPGKSGVISMPLITASTCDELKSARLTPRVIVPGLLYADVRTRISAGGTGKTTVALYEAITLALGRNLWNREISRACKTAIVTREDSREILLARTREIMTSMLLSDEEIAKVLGNFLIIDASDKPVRLSKVENDMVVPNMDYINWLIDGLEDWCPDWIIFDPLVSFGVGESRVNDSEQGLIEAFRLIRNALDCCVEGIHHSGKQNGRDKTLDQYSGRGGSALSDGCRMVAVMQPLNHQEWLSQTGRSLSEDESGIVLALPKISYAKSQDSIYILRNGYHFQTVDVDTQTPQKQAIRSADIVFDFVNNEYTSGRRYSKNDLEACTSELGMSRQKIRDAISNLKVTGRIIYHECRGKSGSHFEPVVTSDPGGDTPQPYPLQTGSQ